MWGGISHVYDLKFKDIVGMEKVYTQNVSICPKCGFIFTANPFSTDQLNTRYKNFSKFEFDDNDYILEESDTYKIRSRRQKDFIRRTVREDSFKSILEVGAASGYNLSLYKDCDVYGIEPSDLNCENAKKNYNIDMFSGVFDEFYANRAGERKYDLIFLSHVLEHIVNPSDFIGKCVEINSKYIFVEVPTFDYKFIDEPFGMFCEEHVNMFTLQSLENLMGRWGYALVDAEMLMEIGQTLPAGWPAISTLWIKSENIVMHKMAFNSEDVLKCYIEKSEEEMLNVRKKIENIPDTSKLGIWGTGHHASMLLANSDLSQKNIVKVYDSDKKRRGMIFAGLPIEPFDCKDIENGRIDTILVATYTAQKAITNILKEYNNKVDIVTLYDI